MVKINKTKTIAQSGTALLVTLLLVGAISAIAFGMTKITLNEVFVGMKSQEGLQAQYAAQAGVEDALMRYKFHDKTDLEMPNGSRKDTTAVVRVYIDRLRDDPGKVSRENNPHHDLPLVEDNGVLHYVYDLKVWSKQDCAQDSCEYILSKDQSAMLDVSEVENNIHVSWDLINNNNNVVTSINSPEARAQTGLWYRLSDPIKPGQIDPTGQSRDFFTFLSYFDPANNSTDPRFTQTGMVIFRNGSNLTTRTAKSLKFKAFIADTINGRAGTNFRIRIRITSGVIGGPETHIESTGYYGNTAKKIEVTVDRESKSIIDIFDYVIYSGSGPLPGQ